jgi:fructokinase
MPDIFSTIPSPLVTVIGEALIDLIPNGAHHEYRALPGGSPFNVAVGLARLGNRIQLLARLSDNVFGRILRDYAENEGIDLSQAPHAIEPTSLAVVSIGDDAKPMYDFYIAGTADWQWTPAELARMDADTAVLHFGSIASWTAPGYDQIIATVATHHERGQILISYDPNIRPLLMGAFDQARATIETCIRSTHIVKASREDLDWIYPGTKIEHVAARWLELGALLVIVTDGDQGAHVYRPGDVPIHRPGRQVNVIDTIGAGDAFTAGLLSCLINRGLVHPEVIRQMSAEALIDAVDKAILVAALTCERHGADPPKGNLTQ